jgi:hypothetical protein
MAHLCDRIAPLVTGDQPPWRRAFGKGWGDFDI